MRKPTQSQEGIAFTEALGDVIIASSELQSCLLRDSVMCEIAARTPDSKLRRDLRRQAGSLDSERALVKFDRALAKAARARRDCFAEATHPSLTLAQPASPHAELPSGSRRVSKSVL